MIPYQDAKMSADYGGVVGRGFVVVDSSDTPVSYTGEAVDLSDIRVISVFHQIHCLVRVNLLIQSDISNNSGIRTNFALVSTRTKM